MEFVGLARKKGEDELSVVEGESGVTHMIDD